MTNVLCATLFPSQAINTGQLPGPSALLLGMLSYHKTLSIGSIPISGSRSKQLNKIKGDIFVYKKTEVEH